MNCAHCDGAGVGPLGRWCDACRGTGSTVDPPPPAKEHNDPLAARVVALEAEVRDLRVVVLALDAARMCRRLTGRQCREADEASDRIQARGGR